MPYRRRTRKKPLFPEPSPRFALWSAVAAALLLGVILTLDYVEGWTGGPAVAAPIAPNK